MQFLVIGYDGADAQALARRMAAREKHLEGMGRLREAGRLLYAAVALGDKGQMSGSMLVVDFDDRAALDSWLKTEPYVVGDVWRRRGSRKGTAGSSRASRTPGPRPSASSSWRTSHHDQEDPARPASHRRRQGALVSKKLRGTGMPRFYMATKRSALAEMPGDTILMNGGGIAQTTQVLEDGGGPLWRGQESPDAAMLPVRLPQGENDKPVPLESLQDGAPGLPAPVADLARLADQVPLR